MKRLSAVSIKRPYLLNSHRSFLLLTLSVLMMSCTGSELSPEEHRENIMEWRANRVSLLTTPGSWLSLAGLHWIDDNKNYTLGSGEENEFIFPSKAPENIGSIVTEGENILFYPVSSVDISVTANQRDVENVEEIDDIHDGVELHSDQTEQTNYVQVGDFEFYLIQRADRKALRVIDYNHPKIKKFEGIDYFPIDQKWRIEAEFIPNEDGSTIGVPNVMGGIYQEQTAGKIKFTIEENEYELDVLPAYGGEQFFVIFGDDTSGKTTYGGGRYLYMKAPEEGDHTTYIDFNKAYNPPCAFTAYATCPLPPPQNRLEVAITAGEKDYHY